MDMEQKNRPRGGQTDLMRLIQTEHYDKARAKLEQLIASDSTKQLLELDDNRNSVLHYAARKVMQDRGCLGVFKRLTEVIPYGLINSANRYGERAVLLLCQHAQHFEPWKSCMEHIIGRGADPGVETLDGRTCLRYVLARGDERFVELLLAMGAQPAAPNETGDNELDAAVFEATRVSHRSAAEREAYVRIVRRLIQANAQPSERAFTYLLSNRSDTKYPLAFLFSECGFSHPAVAKLCAEALDQQTPASRGSMAPRL